MPKIKLYREKCCFWMSRRILLFISIPTVTPYFACFLLMFEFYILRTKQSVLYFHISLAHVICHNENIEHICYFYCIFETEMSIFINAAHRWPGILTNNKANVWTRVERRVEKTSLPFCMMAIWKSIKLIRATGKIALLFVFFYPIL